MIGWLKDSYQVAVLGKGFAISYDRNLDDALNEKRIGFERNKFNILMDRLLRLLLLFVRKFEGLVSLSIVRGYQDLEELDSQQFDLIVAHDLELLPLAFDVAKTNNAKILFDAREFYPREFENHFFWRYLLQPFNDYLCRIYLPGCDKVITVSEGIAEEYKKVYGIDAEVIMSLPNYLGIDPVRPDDNSIRLIYHGQASPDRQIDKMIEVVDYLDERFSLTLMLVSPSKVHRLYWQKIVSMTKKRPRVKIIPPIPMKDIIKFTNQYDIGIFICPPTTFNLQYARPNKFFEYIQARLLVAIGPSIEMQRIVKKYHCGIVASDFEPQSLATELNKLGSSEIMSYKESSNIAARELNASLTGERVREIIQALLSD
jgi:glycosyltransferase involved in cell wall biosynthesis